MKSITSQPWKASLVQRRSDGDWEASIFGKTESVGSLIICGLRSQEEAQQIARLAAAASQMAGLLAECMPGGMPAPRVSDWIAEVRQLFGDSGAAGI